MLSEKVKVFLNQESANYNISIKPQIVNILDFIGHVVLVAAIQICFHILKAAVSDK